MRKLNPKSLLALLLIGLVHCSCLGGAYVFDDTSIVGKPVYSDFGSFDWFAVASRPVTRATFAFQFTYLGETALVSHGVNIAVHLAASFFLYLLLRAILVQTRSHLEPRVIEAIAIAAMLLWGLHPLSTTTVTYVVQRYESLAALAMLASVFFWISAFQGAPQDSNQSAAAISPSIKKLFLSLICALLAFGAKETSAGLPIIMLLSLPMVMRRPVFQNLSSVVVPALLLVPLAIGFFLKVSRISQPMDRRATVGIGIVGIDPVSYVLQQPIVFLRYLKLSFWPTDLVLDYGQIPSAETGVQLVGATLWIVILVLVVYLYRRYPVACWGLIGSLLVLATTSLLPTQDMVFEHRFYLPLAGLISTVCVCVGDRWLTPDRMRSFAAVVSVVAILLSYSTVMRNIDYTSPLSLARADHSRRPENPRGHYRVASLDEQLPETEKVKLLHQAIKLSEDRDFFYAGTNYKWRRALADKLFFMGRLDLAKPYYERTLPESHDDLQKAELLWSLAMIDSMMNRPDAANQRFEEAIALETKITSEVQSAYQIHLQRQQAK